MGKQPEFQGNYERVLDEWREKSRTWDLRKKWGELGLPEYAGENPRLACYGVMYEWNPGTAESMRPGTQSGRPSLPQL